MGSNLFSDLYGDLYGKDHRRENLSKTGVSHQESARKVSSVKSSVDAMEEARKALQEMEEKLQGSYLDKLKSLQHHVN